MSSLPLACEDRPLGRRSLLSIRRRPSLLLEPPLAECSGQAAEVTVFDCVTQTETGVVCAESI